MPLETLPEELLIKIFEQVEPTWHRYCWLLNRKLGRCAIESAFADGIFITIRHAPQHFDDIRHILAPLKTAPALKKVTFATRKQDLHHSVNVSLTKGFWSREFLSESPDVWNFLRKSEEVLLLADPTDDTDTPLKYVLLDLMKKFARVDLSNNTKVWTSLTKSDEIQMLTDIAGETETPMTNLLIDLMKKFARVKKICMP